MNLLTTWKTQACPLLDKCISHCYGVEVLIKRDTQMEMNFTDPEFKRAYQMGFNDGYSSAVSNAQEECGLTEEQADDLLTELVEVE